MELIEVSDHSFLPVSSGGGGMEGHNLILQGFSPAHFINDGGGGGAIELIEEFPGSTTMGMDAQTSYLQVVEPSPTVVMNYIIGSNGSLIPVYDSFPIDNTVTIVTAPEPVSEPTVPPHILDHMYARKPKEPGKGTPAKPRKRVKKKEPPPPPPVVEDFVMPEIITSNTTKVNIIRKGQTVSTPTVTFRPLLTTRPKILQASKSVTSAPQRAAGAAVSDLSSSSSSTSVLTSTTPLITRTYSSASPSPSSVTATSSSPPNESSILQVHSANGKNQPEVPSSSQVYLDFFAFDNVKT